MLQLPATSCYDRVLNVDAEKYLHIDYLQYDNDTTTTRAVRVRGRALGRSRRGSSDIAVASWTADAGISWKTPESAAGNAPMATPPAFEALSFLTSRIVA